MFSFDNWKGTFDWRGDRPDPEPHYGLVFLILLPIAVGVGFVAWLGWSWPALVLTMLTTALIGGIIVFRWIKGYRRERAQDPEWR